MSFRRIWIAMAIALPSAGCSAAPSASPAGTSALEQAPSPAASTTPTTAPAPAPAPVASAPEPLATTSAAPSAPGSPSPQASAQPSARPIRSGPGPFAEADSGATVQLNVGESFTVSLGSDSHQPQAQADAVKRTAAAGGYPTKDAAKATFKAVHAGQTDVVSNTDAGCLHTTPRCGIAQQVWTLHVIVR